MSTTPGRVKQRGSKFNHKLIATELGFRGRCGLLDELCVISLSVVVVVMFAYDGFSGVGLDAAIEYGIHKLLFRLEQQDGLGCTWHESAVEHITDVMCARLRENRAIPVVEMLVVLEDRIDTTVSPNPLSEVIETVGVRSCSCCTARGRSLSNWVVPNSTGRGSKTVEILLSELVPLVSRETHRPERLAIDPIQALKSRTRLR